MRKNKIALAEYKRTRKESPDYPAKWAWIYAKQWAEIVALEADPEIEIELEATQDDLCVRGNALASGDDEIDRACENEIIRRLDSGDVWAWASVEVKVTKGGLSESEYLGGCSYRDAKDFKRGGYYYDMVLTCLDRINSELDAKQDAACRDIVTA